MCLKFMQNQSCKVCNSDLEVESRCKFCDEPTQLFCHTCGIPTKKIMHPACMVIDVNSMLIEAYHHKN